MNEEMMDAVNAIYAMKPLTLGAGGFIAQLVEHRTGIARSRDQTPLKS